MQMISVLNFIKIVDLTKFYYGNNQVISRNPEEKSKNNLSPLQPMNSTEQPIFK